MTKSNERSPLLPHDNAPSESEVSSDAGPPKWLKGAQLYLALTFPNIALFLVAVDVTLITTVSATIASDFSSLAVISWLGSSYLVALAAIQPVSGKLTDIYGRRLGFFLALLAFGVGNLVCGLSMSVAGIVLGRALAGLGGGAVSSITTFLTSDLLPLRQRSTWQGIGNVAWAGGMGIGAAIGGLMNDLVGWRWAFISLVPLTVIVAAGSAFTLPPGPDAETSKEAASARIDVLGGITLTLTLVSLILGLNFAEGGTNALWIWIPLAVAAVLFVCFIVIELRFTTDPIIPIHLLKDRSVAAACLSGLLINASMQSQLYYVPLMIQVRGFSTSETGLQMLGEPLGASVGSFSTGLAIEALGSYAILKPVVFLVYLVAPIGYALSNVNTPIWATVAFLAAMGAGYGSLLAVIQTGLLAVTHQRVQATATSMLYAFRQVGASTGLALSGILFRALVTKDLDKYSPRKPGSGPRQLPNIAKECNHYNYPAGHRPEACIAYGLALRWVFVFTLALGVASFACGMLIRNALLDRDDKKSASLAEEIAPQEP